MFFCWKLLIFCFFRWWRDYKVDTNFGLDPYTKKAVKVEKAEEEKAEKKKGRKEKAKKKKRPKRKGQKEKKADKKKGQKEKAIKKRPKRKKADKKKGRKEKAVKRQKRKKAKWEKGLKGLKDGKGWNAMWDREWRRDGKGRNFQKAPKYWKGQKAEE